MAGHATPMSAVDLGSALLRVTDLWLTLVLASLLLDRALTAALLDRRLHHVQVIAIKGESYRL